MTLDIGLHKTLNAVCFMFKNDSEIECKTFIFDEEEITSISKTINEILKEMNERKQNARS